MSSELCLEQNVPLNTPQTLGVTPRYVLQHNAISRSINSLSATAKKLTVMSMALIPSDLSSLTAAFTFPEFCKALDMPTGGETYKIFKAAVNECMQCVITIETEPNEKNKKTWRKFTWFSEAQYSEETGKATMTFSPQLAEVMRELKWVYSKINLQDFGRLQSRYAIRLYEIALSFAYLKGKQGNKNGAWYFQWTIKELRQILSVPTGAYAETHLFKQKVIDAPIKEINNAGLGLAVKIERVKQGRFLVALRFDCEQIPRRLPEKDKNKKKTAARLELLEPNPRVEQERLEKEYQHMKERYPDEFARLYEEALNKPSPLPLNSLIRRGAAEYIAVTQLKTKHGIAK
jgi:plasmid replication initiation protein